MRNKGNYNKTKHIQNKKKATKKQQNVERSRTENGKKRLIRLNFIFAHLTEFIIVNSTLFVAAVFVVIYLSAFRPRHTNLSKFKFSFFFFLLVSITKY